MKADGSVIINTKMDTSGMKTGLNQIKGSANQLGSSLKRLGLAIGAAFAVKQIAAFSKECINLGSDLEEVQNVVDVTFGRLSGAIEDFSKSAATEFGLSELTAKQYTSTLGAMYKSMGFATEEAAGMSIEMAKLAGDMASFYNLDTDTAFQKIRSGISGETEPLKQLGINLSEANLEEYRLAQGIQTAYSAMNQQDKALLRYNYLLKVTSDAQGDFARTSGSWANQVRILQLQFDSIKANLGQGFINIFLPVLQIINKLLVGLAKLASSFKAFTALITGKKNEKSAVTSADLVNTDDISNGYEDAATATQDYADATDNSTKATQKAAKENKKFLSGLDEIKRYEEDIADTSNDIANNTPKTSTPAISGLSGTKSNIPTVDFGSLEQGDTVVDTLAKKMADLYKTIKEGAQPTLDALKRLWKEGLQKLGQFTWTALRDFYRGFLVPVAKWTFGEGIPRLVNALNNGLMKVNWQKINDGLSELWDSLAPFAINVGEGLVWFWENVLVPLGTWTMNEVVPRFLKTLSTAIDIVNAVIEALQPLWQWFWNNVLLPIAKWTGGVFTSVWDGINAKLKVFAQWCKDNPDIIEAVTAGVIAFFAAWKVATLISKIEAMIQSISGLATFMGGITTSTFNPWIIAIGAIVAAGVLLYKNWDTVKAKAIEIWDALSTYLSEKWTAIKTWAEEKFGAIIDTIKEAWETARTSAVKKWTEIGKNLNTKWNGIKTTASTTFTNIKNAIGTAWENVKTNASNTWANIVSELGARWQVVKGLAEMKFKAVKNVIGGAWDAVSKKASDIWETITTNVTGAWEDIKESAVEKFDAIVKKVSDSWTSLKNGAIAIAKWLKETFTPDWGKVWQGIVNKFGNVFKGIGDLMKKPINAVIGMLNNMIGKINAALAAIESAFTFDFSWDNPITKTHHDWKYSLELPEIGTIPELAKGGVIPPNSPFLATLGDQRHGTNVEAPLETIKQAVSEVVGIGGDIVLTINLDGQVVYNSVLKQARRQQQSNGYNPFELA